MLRGLLLLCLLAFSSQTIAQRIKILDSETELPVSGVLVFGANPQNSEITNVDGEVDFLRFADEEIIYFQFFGYQSQSFEPSEIVEADYRVLLTQSLIAMDMAVVSANRWRQNDHDIATKTRVISSDNLTLRNPSNAADWLGSSGEVFIQKSQQGGGSPMIRGFSANRLLYAVDGVRMNTAIFRSGNLQNVISIDPFSLANTEVLFGPGSVMYGSDAIGGVMSFQTLHPDFSETEEADWSGNLNTRFASANDERVIHGDIALGLKKWAFLSSLSYVDYGDLRMGTNGPDDYLRPIFAARVNGQDLIVQNEAPEIQRFSGYEQLNLMQKIRFEANSKLNFDYGFHYSNTGNIPRYDRLIEGDEDNLRSARWDYGPQTWVMNTLGVNFQNKSKLFDQAKVRFAHQFFEESRITRRFGRKNETNRIEKINALSLNADFIKSLKGEDFLSYGTEVVQNDVNSEAFQKNIDTENLEDASRRYPDSNWLSAAIYGTYHRQFSKKVKLQAGLRYNYNRIEADFSENLPFFPLPFSTTSSDFAALTGSLGIIFAASEAIIFSPVFSTGFRAPNVDDIGKIFDSEPGAVLVPNPDLKPEYAYNWELNINGRVNQRLRFELTGFYTILDQALVRRNFTLDGKSEIVYDGELSQVLAIQNAASTIVYGIQAGVEYSILPGLLFTSRYNWQKGTEELDDESTSPSRHAAPAFGLTRITYQKGKFKAEISSQYAAQFDFEDMPIEEISKPQLYAKDENGNPYSPNWVIFSANSTLNLSEVIQISASIENIANQRYRTYSSGITAPGRNFSLGINASF